MSTYLALLVGFAAGALAGGAAVWALLGRREPQAARPPATHAAPGPEPAPPADEEVRQVMAASQATLEELEGRYRGRRAAGPEEGEAPKAKPRPKPRGR